MASTYAVIESKLSGDKLHGVFKSLSAADKKRKLVNKKKTKTSFGADIYKFIK